MKYYQCYCRTIEDYSNKELLEIILFRIIDKIKYFRINLKKYFIKENVNINPEDLPF